MFIYSRYQTLIVDLSIVLNDIVLNAFLVQAISTYAPNLTNAQSKENPFQKKACWNADKTITIYYPSISMWVQDDSPTKVTWFHFVNLSTFDVVTRYCM